MKIIEIRSLIIPDIKVIRFQRFADDRGYFTETYRQTDFKKVLPDFEIKQINESSSTTNVIRGLHFQWDPYMGKLVRTLYGHMIDFALDIRPNSSTFGKIIGYDMPASNNRDYDEWIWIPKGFAHGNLYLENSAIEYLVDSEYNPDCEAGINPLSPDIDWSICDKKIVEIIHSINKNEIIQSEKDKKNYTLNEWKNNPNSKLFKSI
jgi:dTDP-4-dehydrorhamnose 3,5-epimerase